jgi:hypothetical protein
MIGEKTPFARAESVRRMATRGILRSRSGWVKPNRRVYSALTDRAIRDLRYIRATGEANYMQASSVGCRAIQITEARDSPALTGEATGFPKGKKAGRYSGRGNADFHSPE